MSGSSPGSVQIFSEQSMPHSISSRKESCRCDPLAARARGVKRLRLKRFPFDVIVVERETEALVVAFAHHARRPGYWRQRRG